MAGFALLLAAPDLDVMWQDDPAHFWLVFAVAAVTAALALLMNDAARRRLDARVLLVSLAFFVCAGSLGLHAIATPGVILEGRNASFELDVPIGLLAAALLAVASSLPLAWARSPRIHALVTISVLAVVAVWAVVSLALLDEPLASTTQDSVLLSLAVAGLVLYAAAGARYFLLWRRRPSSLLVAVFTAFVLLAEAMVAIAFARNWHATWWEWHLLILLAFGVVAASVSAEWKAEGPSADVFADVYQEETSAGMREVSILFADLKGFTSFSEQATPRDVFAMLNTYFDAIVPAVARGEGGTVDKLIGDAIMLTFNTRGDQPDHALRAARAGLALQREASRVQSARPGWPRFRVGINTGPAIVGLLGPRGARSYTVVGDVVNVAARLEGSAGVGEVVVGERTREALGSGAYVEAREEIALKGKAETVRSFRLVSVDSTPHRAAT
jgi:class 3 adenylate cyclase